MEIRASGCEGTVVGFGRRMKEDELLPLAKILIKRGAKRKEKTADGKTASQIAEGKGYKKLAKVLH